eukprot:Rhum_TRINITY_DN11895_c0_g1::Rhum_TRINITY_DN11895_c0_g1_i1::g.47610::m.47610
MRVLSISLPLSRFLSTHPLPEAPAPAPMPCRSKRLMSPISPSLARSTSASTASLRSLGGVASAALSISAAYHANLFSHSGCPWCLSLWSSCFCCRSLRTPPPTVSSDARSLPCHSHTGRPTPSSATSSSPSTNRSSLISTVRAAARAWCPRCPSRISFRSCSRCASRSRARIHRWYSRSSSACRCRSCSSADSAESAVRRCCRRWCAHSRRLSLSPPSLCWCPPPSASMRHPGHHCPSTAEQNESSVERILCSHGRRRISVSGCDARRGEACCLLRCCCRCCGCGAGSSAASTPNSSSFESASKAALTIDMRLPSPPGVSGCHSFASFL